jgi:putative flippase GtrA
MTAPGAPPRPSFLASFSRSQVASAAATLADYAVLFGLTELAGVWYVAATAIGAGVGAVTNFLLNRHWSFRAGHLDFRRQARRYAAVSAGSLALNAGGVWALTEWTRIHYSIPVFAVSLAVGFLFNFPLHRHYVFR